MEEARIEYLAKIYHNDSFFRHNYTFQQFILIYETWEKELRKEVEV